MIVYFLLVTVVLPQISESIFSPCLPLIADIFSESMAMCEHVFTTYLMGYAIGMLLWGTLSDYLGRIKTLRFGLGVYLLGVLLCYHSSQLSHLLVARLVQGIGGSACSVLVMAMCRDYFEKEKRAGMLAKIGMAISIGPMLGPLMGASVLLVSHWYNIYIILFIYALVIITFTHYLPKVTTLPVFPDRQDYFRMLTHRKIWMYAILIGHACGIGFSFLSEAPFFYKVVLGLSEAQFSLCFMLVGVAWYCGGQISYQLLRYYPIERVMLLGIMVAMISCTGFIAVVKLALSDGNIVLLSLGFVFMIMTGLGLVIGNAITLALEPFSKYSGMASSILGFLYYSVIALVAAGMAEFHNGTLLAMPLYWFNVLMVCLMVILSIQPEKEWLLGTADIQ